MRSSFPTPAISRRPLHMMPWHSLHRLERILGLLPMAFVISPFIFWRWLIYCWTFYPVYPIDLLCCGAKRIWGYKPCKPSIFRDISDISYIYIYIYSIHHWVIAFLVTPSRRRLLQQPSPAIRLLEASTSHMVQHLEGNPDPQLDLKWLKRWKKNRSRW